MAIISGGHCPLCDLATAMTTTPSEMAMPDWGKIEQDNKIAKLPKRIRLKTGEWVYLR